ncbi:alpha/beta hydrolase [Salipiger sp. IMCC34102]|uniref:alpha/beta hydrolase n=1 Tax=Salipiger sp. IMCC34102 TaxID=2510647 RepID=UPI00101D299A|nr:alpha/beta hydrolase [Salipiger sp. IMCC34102]RYH00972.1 alpha/beta hydrolase [Salipiger sp. IMCC34102]
MTDWNDAYANAAHIPDAESYSARWPKAAQAFRDEVSWSKIAYGAAPRETLDLFCPEGTPKGLMIFIHGGYWRDTDPSMWSHLSRGALARGWAVAQPGYTLAPENRIHEINAQIARAVRRAADEVAGPVRLVGHSAGGHLALRMVCADSLVPARVLDRIAGVTSISGLHDLRPLLWTDMNDTLGLTEAEATAESPVLQRPARDIPVTAWVGADERPAFVLQARQLAAMWGALGARIRLEVEPNRHHFDVIDGLCDPDSALLSAVLGD